MDFSESEEILALRDSLRRYVARECPPEKANLWDREDFIPRDELAKLTKSSGGSSETGTKVLAARPTRVPSISAATAITPEGKWLNAVRSEAAVRSVGGLPIALVSSHVE